MGGGKLTGFGCLILLLLGHSGMSSAAPSEFEMNGIVMAPGARQVFLRTHDATGREINFMLTEGQSRNGITLLSVDTKSNLARFDNHGTLQVLKICPTPEVIAISANSPNRRPAAAAPPPSAGTSKTVSRTSTPDNPLNAPVGAFNPGYPGVAARGGNSSAVSGGAPPDGTTGANTGNGAATGIPSTSDSSSGDKASWWYTGSQEIEQARLATAAAVRNGDLPAYPLTPLTPSGTPPELIGPEQAFFNHFTRQYHAN